MTRSIICATALLIFFAAASRGEDWPQFRGPTRNGISRETGLLKEWPESGPKLLWTYEQAGLGYSGPAIVGDRLYMAGGRGDAEYLFAIDLKTVKENWTTKIGPLFDWKGNDWNRGPNITPTVDGTRIYALGGRGDLIGADLATGKELWRKNLPRDLGGEVNPIGGGTEDPTPLGWGYAGAPLIDGDNLICVPGGKKGLIAALNKNTGDLVWQSGDIAEQASYSSPIAVEIDGVKQYIQAINSGIVGVRAQDGKTLWTYRRKPAYDDVVISTPVFKDNYVFTSVGFQQGCDLLKIGSNGGAFSADKIFSNKSIENRDGGVVLVDGYLYGHSENKGWFCQEFKTGKIAWTERESLGRGSIAYADGRLYCCAEKGGVVVLLEATPMAWTEKGRLKLPRESTLRKPSGCLWTHPVVANGKLYIRDQELLFCYDLKK